MPLVNIIDRRTNTYDVEVDAVFEPAYHDNSIRGATQFSKSKGKDFHVDSSYKTTIEDAINLVNHKYKNTPVTMFLYDSGNAPLGDAEEYFEMN